MKTYYVTSEDCSVGMSWQDIVQAESEDMAFNKVSRARGTTSVDIDAYQDENGDIFVWTRGFAQDMPYIKLGKDIISVLAQWSGIPNGRFDRIIKANSTFPPQTTTIQ